MLAHGLAGCSSASGNRSSSSDSGSTTEAQLLDGGFVDGTMSAPSIVPTIPVPDGGVPAAVAQTTLTLTSAPALGTVNYIPNRSSVRLYLPGVANARDYRVFAVDPSVTVSTQPGNLEYVQGATIHCAGLRQRNQCDDGEVLPIKYNNSLLDLPVCEDGNNDRRPNVPASLMQTMDVNGIGPNTTLVVEAIDRQCPFPGLYGSTHMDVPIGAGDLGGPKVQATVNNKPYTLQLLTYSFPLRTEAEITADYGSMIFNGQGPNMPTLDPTSPAFPESPWIRIAQPAPPSNPVVLARSVVSVSPSGDATLPAGFTAQDYFDDFDDPTDQPTLLRNSDPAQQVVGGTINVYETKKWVLYDVNNQFSNFFVDRGQMNMVMGDPYQDSMSVQAMYPKRPVQLPTQPNQYLHVTYEVQRNETNRRYENLSLCGSDKMGQTYNGETPMAAPEPRPGFMNPDTTARSSVLGWNCLTLVGRGPGYYEMPGGDVVSHADTSLKVTVVRTQPPPMNVTEYGVLIPQYASVYGPTLEPPGPFLLERQLDSMGKPSGVWLDDQENIWQRARFDVFIRRDQVVIYVEGQQRECQNIDPAGMTMAEGALGFWHILYHTSAEFIEIRATGGATANPSTDQHHVIHNTPFADERSYDNVGFQENVGVPANFDATRCYTATPPDGGSH